MSGAQLVVTSHSDYAVFSTLTYTQGGKNIPDLSLLPFRNHWPQELMREAESRRVFLGGNSSKNYRTGLEIYLVRGGWPLVMIVCGDHLSV